jgi:hypothetical protein
MQNNNLFYKDLPAFKDFSQLTDNSRFIDIPDSWNVVITDVKGSTQAVREGRYKDVNLVGAASITCALNISNESEIPFVFGGDGATMLIPDDLLLPLMQELKGLQRLAQSSFKLQLRVGYISMKDLRKSALELQVAKYELSPGNYTAQFKGGALLVAEEMIKKGLPTGATIIQPSTDEFSPQLDGLSCRLTPLKNRNGIILSILAKPTTKQSEEILIEVLSGLKRILNDDFLSARPVSLEKLFWRWPPQSIFSEIKTQKGKNSLFKQIIQTGLQTLVTALSLTFNIPLGAFKPKNYKNELITNSDYKKFDETLRMVIDCTLEQTQAIENFLQKLKDDKKIAFGIHKSTSALMTCVVKSASTNKHIHFIDGADGGYTLAAAQMKGQ